MDRIPEKWTDVTDRSSHLNEGAKFPRINRARARFHEIYPLLYLLYWFYISLRIGWGYNFLITIGVISFLKSGESYRSGYTAYRRKKGWKENLHYKQQWEVSEHIGEEITFEMISFLHLIITLIIILVTPNEYLL